MTAASEALERLAPESLPALAWQPDWGDVLERAGAGARQGVAGRRRLRPTRRVAIVLAVIAAVVVPLVAFAAANHWWFFDFGNTPSPVSKPVVVTEGSWSGHSWKLVAYNTRTDGTCWSISFDEQTGYAKAVTHGPGIAGHAASVLSCGSIVGIKPPHGGIDIPTIGWATGANEEGTFPSWIAGPVVDSAATVVIQWQRAVLHVPTVGSSRSLGKIGWFRPIRFFAAPLPQGVEIGDQPLSLTGFDARGRVVACSVPTPTTDINGWSPLSACEP